MYGSLDATADGGRADAVGAASCASAAGAGPAGGGHGARAHSARPAATYAGVVAWGAVASAVGVPGASGGLLPPALPLPEPHPLHVGERMGREAVERRVQSGSALVRRERAVRDAREARELGTTMRELDTFEHVLEDLVRSKSRRATASL